VGFSAAVAIHDLSILPARAAIILALGYAGIAARNPVSAVDRKADATYAITGPQGEPRSLAEELLRG
jgi:hypothetical protein